MYALLKTRTEEPYVSQEINPALCSIPDMKPEITAKLVRKLLTMHVTSFDWQQGGLNTPIKFLDRDSIEYSLVQGAAHDRNEQRMARMTLEKGLQLIDPAWGGIYQFSTSNRWDHPHYAKTMSAQAGCLRIYSLAFALMRDHRFLLAARSIRDYMREYLLSPEAAFYAGQTDRLGTIKPSYYFSLAANERSRYGIPQIDKQLFARENGWAIEALATFYELTGEHSALGLAINASEWVLSERTLAEGGFRHNKYDDAGPFLADTLAIGRAMLQLYRVTTDNNYLQYAVDAAEFIAMQFKRNSGGFHCAVLRKRADNIAPQIDENISVTRFMNLLGHYTNSPFHKTLATHGLRYLAVPQVATSRMEEAGVLLVNEEYSTPPLKITVIGDKTDAKARKLYETAMRAFGWYKLIEWLEPCSAEACVFNDNSPVRDHPVAYITNEYYRSGPISEPDRLAWLIKTN